MTTPKKQYTLRLPGWARRALEEGFTLTPPHGHTLHPPSALADGTVVPRDLYPSEWLEESVATGEEL